jgi:hypothetical protein
MAEDSGLKTGDNASNNNNHDGAGKAKRRKTGNIVKTVIGSALFVAVISAIISPPLGGLGSHVFNAIFGQRAEQPKGPPVKIDLAEQYPDYGEHGGTEALLGPLSPAQLDSLNSLNVNSSSYEQWFTRHGAIPVGDTIIDLVVKGNSVDPVRIINIQPVEKCSRPLTNALLYEPPAGADTFTRLALNLDEPLAPAGYYVNADELRDDYFHHVSVSLRRGEQFTFEISARTTKYYCQFTLNMTVLDNAHTMVETISDHGQPFRVTATVFRSKVGGFKSYKYIYTPTGLVGGPWVRVNPATFNGNDPPAASHSLIRLRCKNS